MSNRYERALRALGGGTATAAQMWHKHQELKEDNPCRSRGIFNNGLWSGAKGVKFIDSHPAKFKLMTEWEVIQAAKKRRRFAEKQRHERALYKLWQEYVEEYVPKAHPTAVVNYVLQRVFDYYKDQWVDLIDEVCFHGVLKGDYRSVVVPKGYFCGDPHELWIGYKKVTYKGHRLYVPVLRPRSFDRDTAMWAIETYDSMEVKIQQPKNKRRMILIRRKQA